MIYKYGNFETELDAMDIDSAEKMGDLITALEDMKDVKTDGLTVREAGLKLCDVIDGLLVALFGSGCIYPMFGEFKNIRQRFEALQEVINVWKASYTEAADVLKGFA